MSALAAARIVAETIFCSSFITHLGAHVEQLAISAPRHPVKCFDRHHRRRDLRCSFVSDCTSSNCIALVS
jgi:hypothetical protein